MIPLNEDVISHLIPFLQFKVNFLFVQPSSASLVEILFFILGAARAGLALNDLHISSPK
jgi:hypothetical protein